MWNISQIMSIKQYKLAELLGIDQSGVSRLENNRVIQGRCITENSKYIEYLSPNITEAGRESSIGNLWKKYLWFGNSHNYSEIINDNDFDADDNRQINPLNEIIELTILTSELYERMLTTEREKMTCRKSS